MSAALALVPDLLYSQRPASGPAAQTLRPPQARASAPGGIVLPWVWAFAEPQPHPAAEIQPGPEPALAPQPAPAGPNLAFYRKYTHALLRRYLRMSLEAGRTPSLLGQQEMFRARVTHYRVQSFEDVVIFLHDIDRCLERLTARHQDLIARIALQEFSIEEVSATLGQNQRTVIAGYGRALDHLTELFLRHKILEPQKCCQ